MKLRSNFGFYKKGIYKFKNPVPMQEQHITKILHKLNSLLKLLLFALSSRSIITVPLPTLILIKNTQISKSPNLSILDLPPGQHKQQKHAPHNSLPFVPSPHHHTLSSLLSKRHEPSSASFRFLQLHKFRRCIRINKWTVFRSKPSFIITVFIFTRIA